MGETIERFSRYIARKICSRKYKDLPIERRAKDRITTAEIMEEIRFLKEQGGKLYKKDTDKTGSTIVE